ncbi:MAG: SMC family ATPase [bacterium]|nr:SMC family ATPase [bacterium]
MDPVTLRLSNFACYRDATVDFRPITMAALVGSNGAGKSSLVDCLLWALFGESTKGGAKGGLDQHVTRGESDCRVELQFRLGGQTYRVIRTRSLARNKSMLEFHQLVAGDWHPLGGRTLADTQTAIEGVLRMDYRTFTASSIILQERAASFTADMTDAERKEVLARILGLDLWDRLQERARERLRAVRQEISTLEARVRDLEQKAGARAATEAELMDCRRQLARAEAEASAAQEEVSRLEVSAAREPDLRRRVREAEDKGRTAWAEGQRAEKAIASAKAEMEGLRALLARRQEIEEAVATEASVTPKIAELDRQAAEVYRLTDEVARLTRLVAGHDAKVQSERAGLESRREALLAQAKPLGRAPCAEVPDYRDNCPLLAGARKAADEAGRLADRLSAPEPDNPHRAALVEAEVARNTLEYDGDRHEMLRSVLRDARSTASLKPRLEAADARTADLKRRINEEDERQKAAVGDYAMAHNRADAARKELASLTEAVGQLEVARQRLRVARATEASTRTDIGRLEQLVADARKAADALAAALQALDAASRDELVYHVLDQACSTKGGVPALMIENAVPQLERLANELLDRMAGGRFHVRLDTQAEGKTTGTMQEVLRITVLDAGEERPYQTYSGAERFLVNLALRIALSKFLAHRAGAEIRLLVLDEGIGCCDASNRAAVMDAIRAVSAEFGKCLVVTHLDELKDSLPQRVEVTRHQDGSHVKVVA